MSNREKNESNLKNKSRPNGKKQMKNNAYPKGMYNNIIIHSPFSTFPKYNIVISADNGKHSNPQQTVNRTVSNSTDVGKTGNTNQPVNRTPSDSGTSTKTNTSNPTANAWNIKSPTTVRTSGSGVNSGVVNSGSGVSANVHSTNTSQTPPSSNHYSLHCICLFCK